jgi:hypothetical protein
VVHKTQRLSVGMSDGEWRGPVDSSHRTISSFPSASDVMHYRNLNQALFSGQFVSRTTQGNAMHDGSNRSLGERVHDALVEAAQLKNEAFKLERKYKRTLKAHIIVAEGKSFGERETKASVQGIVTEAEDAWIAAQLLANTAIAEADGLQIQWESWRTNQANDRAAMNLR